MYPGKNLTSFCLFTFFLFFFPFILSVVATFAVEEAKTTLKPFLIDAQIPREHIDTASYAIIALVGLIVFFIVFAVLKCFCRSICGW